MRSSDVNAYAPLLYHRNAKNLDCYYRRQWRVIAEFNVSKDRLLEVFMPCLIFLCYNING
jgi:hypothetical protein